MVDPDRRPTAQEIEELIDLVRRDPGSPAFIDLGEAYLALGRPRDAIQVGNVGLGAAPDSLEGRVMLARAHAAMHQWKEAQGELLRVVKVDRSNRAGFALLGEVLLRRADFERAVPVLQHAQNLDPTSPQILTMLRRARAGQPLDPPPAPPSPIPPRGETHYGVELPRGPAPAPAGRGPAPMLPAVPAASPAMPTMAIEPAPAAYPEASAGYAAPAPTPPAMRMQKQTAPPPMSVEGIRPRIVSGQKQHNAAAASLRQSAAVGETYLNDLLTGGLLDVAGVRVPDEHYDLRPDRRWGRSTRRAFVFLFVVLVLGIGGGGTWYWWSEKQQAEAVARLQRDAKLALGEATFDGLSESLGKLTEALAQDKTNTLTFAYTVEVGGLASLLYGTQTDEVDRAHKAVAQDIAPGDAGWRELVIGKAALELSRLHQLEPRNAASTLGEVNKLLDAYLAKHADDRWARWLHGRALLAAGERKAARAAFKTAGEGEAGLAVALIDQGDLSIDDGKLEEGLALHKQATQKAKDHPLAVLGRSVGRAEASYEIDETIGELNDKFNVSKLEPQHRAKAYRNLAIALAHLSIEDYPRARTAVAEATAGKPPGEPRFWARVAWVYYVLGDLKSAATARDKCVWYGTNKAEDDPSVQLVDAALELAGGVPEKALDKASKLDGVRPRIIRTYALLDLGKPKEALAVLDEITQIAGGQNVEAQILREQARMVAASEKERSAIADELASLARKSNTKLGRHALGIAWLASGAPLKAKVPLTTAITDVSDTSPNPLAYRTRTALAEVAIVENDLVEAGKQLDAALAANSGYLPARAMMARALVRNKDPEKALTFLEPVLAEPAAVTPSVHLTMAEILISKKRSTAKDKDQARLLLTGLKDKQAMLPAGELARVAALLDEDLAKELGGTPEAAPVEPPPPAKKAKKKSSRRRRGR